MKNLWQDLRYGARMLLKQPGFTLIAVVTLALGIGANTAVFTWLKAVYLQPLPGVNTDGLLYVFSGNEGAPYNNSSYPDYVDFRDQQQGFADLAAVGNITAGITTGGGADERTELVTGALDSGTACDAG